MRAAKFNLIILFSLLLISNCGTMHPKWKSITITKEEQESLDLLNIQQDQLKKLKAKALHEFSPNELDIYLGVLQTTEFDLRKRIQHLAQKCLNQPYKMFLLGEFPFELYDPDPLYSLNRSDCVVFSEHIYAMALSYDWKSFFAMLQRIRYKNGEIGLASRNHYTEFDWDVNNSWLVHDMTEELAGDETSWETAVVDRAKFLSKWGIGQMIPVDTVRWSYIPYELLPKIIDRLQPGDFVNIVRGYEGNKWVGHVGLITKSDDGTVNFLHSTSPKVKQEPLLGLYQTAQSYNEERRIYNQQIKAKNDAIRAYNKKLREKNGGKPSPKEKNLIASKPYFYGFKFLRLQDDPIWELIKIDGQFAPRLQLSPVFD